MDRWWEGSVGSSTDWEYGQDSKINELRHKKVSGTVALMGGQR